ncbi:DUF7691 family protein [Streptomyces lanatus]|uniref:DUF7691 domain-containing protein n=1 Tax=Streptomyces lanatus TaxID=66900 RepID=A0ABV1XRK3_9ACTN|nr:hypothetical protein [Streptomyces lanatus]GHH04907.1 hypothetical protein GCM10018780_35840 [Streptomyces lanatus]
MSRIISYNTVEKADVLAFLGAGDSLTPDQQRVLGSIRGMAERSQRSLDHQGIDWGLSVPDALDHLLAGHARSEAEYAAGAYYRALQHIIDCNGSDSAELGVYSKPSTFFGAVDEELLRLGVSRELLLHDHVFSGPPDEIPFAIPYPVDGPHIGMFPLARAKPAADAYRAVLDEMEHSLRYDVQQIIGKLDDEHREWEWATKNLDWYHQDTIFFSITG